MSDFGVVDGFPRAESLGALTGSTAGTSVTSGGAVFTYGSWVQFVAATSFEYASITVMVGELSKAGWFYIDIAIGAAGSEVVIVSGLYVRQQSVARTNSTTFDLPIKVPAGARVSVRAGGETASTVGKIALIGRSGGLGARPFNYMGLLGNPGGTFSGYTANVKGAWITVNGGTTQAYRALHVDYVYLDFDSNQSSSMFADLGIGAAGSEKIILPNLYASGQNTGGIKMFSRHNFRVEGSIPIGTRIAVRVQTSAVGSSKNWLFPVYGYL